ncbi:hypothetical protein RHSIM_Rhsim02G0230200 [Rhododendron simsii]|uniref:F-box domain-containing protein n=1 Tax=Rhododendron simsii TaxID=118357 RepID=A0A834HAJ6_RHOSS|nr:hypothetical protein RHSIM_Rhsim02G0230200 [Rhododendron simsii]
MGSFKNSESIIKLNSIAEDHGAAHSTPSLPLQVRIAEARLYEPPRVGRFVCNGLKSDKIPWTDQIAKYLDGESLANLAMTCRWLEQEMTDDTVWKFACLRDLKVHDLQVPMAITWRQLYASVFSKTPALLLYTCEEKVLDRKRIGGFIFESPVALVMGKFILPDMIEEDTLESSQKLLASGYCELHNIRTGIWIADLKKIKNISRGEYVIFEARYIELSLNEAYMAGGWIYEELGYHHISEHANAAPCGIVDFEHIRDPSTSEVFDLKSWAGKEKINYIDSCTKPSWSSNQHQLPTK